MLSDILLASGLIVYLVPTLLRNREEGETRRIFWGCVALSCVFMFLAAYPDITRGFAVIAFVLFATWLYAYFATSYIKIRGKVYAFNTYNSNPGEYFPDSYAGMATAKKMWWLLVFAAAFCSLGVLMRFIGQDYELWVAVMMGSVLVVCAIVYGYGDASWEYPVARGQVVPQFILTGVVSAGVFPAVYLIGYALGKRFPFRTRRSMEYGAHPRLRHLCDDDEDNTAPQ